MKRCGRCEQLLPVDAFYLRRRRGRTERSGYCKICSREYGRPWRGQYKKSEHGRSVERASWARNNPRRTPVLSQDERRARRLECHRASEAVQRALKSGQLLKPDACQACGSGGATIEAHHHLGYAKKHHLDVQWLCRRCHEVDHHHPYVDVHSVGSEQ